MKNKEGTIKTYKDMFEPIMYFFISFVASSILLYIVYLMLDNLYRQFKYTVVNYIVDCFMYIKYKYLGDSIYILIILILSIIMYSFITSYKKKKNMALLMETVEAMAKGDLERVISI